MTRDFTKGSETKAIIIFAVPMIIGNLFQQLYNIADSIIVGRYMGAGAFAAVGSSYTLTTFLTSIILGLCIGAGAVFSQYFGAREKDNMQQSIFTAFFFTLVITAVINVLALLFLNPILSLLNTPAEIFAETAAYLQTVLYGLIFIFLYNFFAAVLRAVGNSMVPLLALIVSSVLHVVLAIWFVGPLQMGIVGVAWSTVISQFVSAVYVIVYCALKMPEIRIPKQNMVFRREIFKKVANYSVLASVQQSIMNFGILMIQGLINSFGVVVMVAFSAAVKIEQFAYMPVQDFGNAFSTYVAQNVGARKNDRIRTGIRSSVKLILIACAVISTAVVVFAKPLLKIFIEAANLEAITIGQSYLYVVAPFYCFIGFLFLFYGFYRGLGRVNMSIVLTIISLGIRVALAYLLSAIPAIGLYGIWVAIPTGWVLADIVGFVYYRYRVKDTLQ